jgi:hypothetical protein
MSGVLASAAAIVAVADEPERGARVKGEAL